MTASHLHAAIRATRRAQLLFARGRGYAGSVEELPDELQARATLDVDLAISSLVDRPQRPFIPAREGLPSALWR